MRRPWPTAVLAWIGIALLALCVRLPAALAGLPYINYIDEGNYLHPVAQILRTGNWDPGWYLYPTLPLTAVAAAAHAYDPIYAAGHGGPLRQGLIDPVDEYYDLLAPVELLGIGRALSLAMSLGVVLLTGLLARRLAGGRAGFLAAFAAALVPALAIRGGVATVNPYAVFFTLACLLFADRLRDSPRPNREALAAGAMAGLAFASKYPAVLVAVAFAAIVFLVRDGWRERLRLWALGALGALAGAIAGIPALLTHPRAVLGGVFRQGDYYTELPSPATFWQQAFRRAEWDLPYPHPEIGWPLLLAGMAGLLAGAFRLGVSGTVRAWWLYLAVTLALFTRYGYQPFRNLLPLVPLVCIGLALLVAFLCERLPRPIWAEAGAYVLVAALFGPPLSAYARERLACEDSRRQAVDWLAAHTTPGDTVLVLRELAFLPSELQRPRARVETKPFAAAEETLSDTTRAPPRFLVLGDLTTKQGRPVLPPARRREILAGYELRVRFGETATPPFPDWWRGNRQIVYVLEHSPPRLGS